MAVPDLSSIEPTRLVFSPGDRILVKVTTALSGDQVAKIERAVKSFAGEDVRVLVFNCLTCHMTHHRATEPFDRVLCSRKDARNPVKRLGIAELSCEIIDLRPQDKLTVYVPAITSASHARRVENYIKEWTGPEIEILLLTGAHPEGGA